MIHCQLLRRILCRKNGIAYDLGVCSLSRKIIACFVKIIISYCNSYIEMSQKLNLPRVLKKGDKKVITIEEVVNDCIIVSMIYQNRKFCGALMDTTKRRGPYGIAENNSENDLSDKISPKAPFPQPLLTRHTYKQDVSQPPLPKISRKLRKCRRKPQNSVIDNAFNAGKIPRVANATQAQLDTADLAPPKAALGKRKINISQEDKDDSKIQKLENSNFDNDPLSSMHATMASPVTHLIPQKEYTFSATAVVRLEPTRFDHDVIIQPPTGNTFFEHINNFKKHLYDSNDVVSQPNSSSNDAVQILTESDCENMLATLEVSESRNKRKTRKPKLVKPNDSDSTNSGNESPDHKELDMFTKSCLKHNRGRRTCARTNKSQNDIPERDSRLSRSNASSKHSPKVIAKSMKEKSDDSLSSSGDKLHGSLLSTKYPIDGTKKTETSKQSKRFKRGSKPSENENSHVIYVTRCKDAEGATFTRGDIVWGKLVGYPWWPCRIVKLIVTKVDGQSLQQEAMVGWFHFQSTSILPLRSIQQFEQNFSIRYDKKRKGLYQRAVVDAKKAVKKITPEVRKLIAQFET